MLHMNKIYVGNIYNNSFSIIIPKGYGNFEFDSNILQLESTEIINRQNIIGDESKIDFTIKYNFKFLTPISTEIEFNYSKNKIIYVIDYRNKKIYEKNKLSECSLS